LGFPLERHMAVVLTTHRLITWRARWIVRRVQAQLAEIPRSSIASVTMANPAHGSSRTVSLVLRNGLEVKVWVEAKLADALVRELGVRH
jgi:hypothetical protein